MILLESIIGVYEGVDNDEKKLDAEHTLVIFNDEDGNRCFAYYYTFESRKSCDELYTEGLFEVNSKQNELTLHQSSQTKWGLIGQERYARKEDAKAMVLNLMPDADKFSFQYNDVLFRWRNDDIDFVLGWFAPIRLKAKSFKL